MSGTPNWNPRLQTSSVRFPRKAVETPQIPPNTTARPMPGAPFQPVYPNPITQIPTITATANPSNPRPVFNQLYTLSAGFGEVITYPGRRGVPTPTVILQKTNERYLVFGVNFPYQMSGTDHFVFTFVSQNTGEQIIKNFQPAPQYIVGGLLPGVLYTLTVAPMVNGIAYPGSAPPLGPLTISAVSEKNVQLQGVTLRGGDSSATIQWINATPQPPLAFEVTTVAVDDNFGTPQRLLKVIPTYPTPPPGERPTNYSGYVPITNLINGSAYTFTITPYQETDGIFEYGRPTTLPPYIPGPPGDLVITGISADGSLNTVTLNVTYDTTVHPVPEATKISVYKSTLTTVCSLVGQSPTVVQDLSQTYASFTTSAGFFTPQGFAYLVATVSSSPGSIQVDLLNDKGYFYTFPLTDVSTGELGYTFGNSNFVKTTNLISTASSYSVLFRSVSLGDSLTPYISGIGQTVLTLPNLPSVLCTFVGSNFANGISSRVSTYTTIAVGKPDQPQNITGTPGNQFVSLAFSGYNPAGTFPRPTSYLYTETGSGKTYTSITSNILIGGLVNGSAYTFGIQGFGNGVYGPSGQFSVTPAPQPPTNLSASISNYDVTISFAPAFGGADSYQITNQSGQTVGLVGGLYKFMNLSANVAYTFRGKSFVYGSPIYTLSSTDPSTSIVEISSAYAQFLVSPSVATISYASTMITNIQYFVPYNYTISGGGTTYSFPITSMTPVYDASATLLYYNIANTNFAKAAVTFSGATTYTTTLSTTVPLFPGMIPTTSSGTISSAFSLPTSPSAYVGPPTSLFVTASLASSQRVDITVQSYGLVVPTRYNYTEISGKIAPGFSLSTNIVIENLTNGSSYTFTISAFGNQVYSTTGVSAGPFLLSTAAPSNAVAKFSNTTARVDFSTYVGVGITYFGEIIENGYPGTVKQTLSQVYSPFAFSPDGINAGINYGFRVYGVQNNICSANEIVNPIIAGPPFTPKNIVSTLSQNQITFDWSTGNAAYSETYTITEYLSNNGVCNATGLIKSGLSSPTYTISSVITASGTLAYDYGRWLETTPGYASFVLQNVTNFTDVPIGSKYSSNQIYLTLQQSGLTYTFPLSTVTPLGTGSNTYANTKYPKDPGNIFNPLLSLSVTYSYGTGPRNGGTYSYAFTSVANQVPSQPSNVGVNMFVQPVLGIPSVSVTGRAVTISFAQTNPPGTVYRVTNNYGATVSRAPYTFTNLSAGTSFPYTFSVVAANGVFVSVSSDLSPPVYVGPPPIPLVGASYFGQVASVTAIDTTISLTTVFYDTGTQNTGQNVSTLSHGNVIQTSSGGFWVASLPPGYDGSIKDSAIGFVATTASSYAMYSNDGYSNARYQFTAAPSTGTITATLSAYSLIISGSSLAVTNAGVQVYSGTTVSPSYTVQFFSYSNGFGIQSGEGGGNNLLYYSQVPAGSDSLVFTVTDAASFSNFQASRIQNVGPATVSYGIVDQFNTVYNPSLQFATYTPNGLQYTYSIFNIPYAITLKLGITPFANRVSGPAAFVDIYLYTGSPGTPQVSILNTTATITVPKVAIGSVDTYFLDIITGGATISTLSAVATASPTYIFQYPDLVQHSYYYFAAYAKYNGNPTTTGPVTVGPYEAGKPYSGTDFPGLVPGSAGIGNPNSSTGTYTISALVNPGKNSNAAITTRVYTGTTFVTSQTINTSQQQVFSFTVSSGAVYALTTTAFMNGFTANSVNPSITLSANPFPPQAVALTISSADRGQTYGGAITITASSATPNVSNVYGYTKNGISTDIILGGNTFTAVYNSSYTGYAYTTAAGGTLSSSITYSTLCNVFISPPTNVQVDYNNINISLTWTGATDGSTNFYTVIASNTTISSAITTTISENIQYSGQNPQKYSFIGSIGNSYTFTVQGQSQRNPSSSLIYSLPISAGVSLSTGSVDPSAYYSGSTITVSFGITNLTTFSSLYTFGVTCVCGSVTSPYKYSDNTLLYQSPYTFNASGLGQILRFAVQPLLKGILGPVAYTNTINLTTSALTNITQSYTGTTYTISWTPITTPPGYIYVIRDVCDSVTQQTIQTSASSSTQFTLSSGTSYQFQAYAIYNGIQSVSSTLSRIYTYTNPVSGAPTTSYNSRSIVINWSAAIQADGNLARSYLIENIYYSTSSAFTICSAFVGTSYPYTGTTGSDYTFAITAKYNGFDASMRAVGEHIGLYTNPPTNVGITNSGQNIVVTWSGSSWPPASQGTIFYTLSQIGNGTLTAGSDGSGRFTTSATVYAPNTLLPISSIAYYNYVITASAKGFTSSPFASATVSGLVFTYAPTNVVFTYTGLDTRTSPAITTTQSANQTITPKVSWENTSIQSSTAVYTVSLVDITVSASSPTNSGLTQPGINYWTNPSILYPTINLARSNYGHSVVPYVYATNNGLASETISGSAVLVYTAPPGVVGVGFDGLYRITFSLCRGDTSDIPDYYTIWERNDAYKTNTQSGDYPLSYFTVSYDSLKTTTVYTIPLTGIQGYTYNFGIYATRFGVVSALNTTLSRYTLETTPVTDTSTSVSYSGTTITFSWSEAMQKVFTGETAKPNVGYTIYVTPGNPFIPLVNAYKNLSYNFVGTPGQSYYFTIEAVNNNITSSPTQSGIITLYQPVVTNLAATNTCENDRDVSMILTWSPDIVNASGAQYRAVSFNQTTGATVTSNNIGQNSSTVTFTGSIGVAYTFFVQGVYKGISGLAQSVQISNARPIITSFSLTNLGNNIFAQYTVTPIDSIVTLSVYNTTLGSSVTSISYTSATTATLTVSSAVSPGIVYSISATARYVGIPSTICGKTYTMIQPAKPSSFSAGYNNTLVSLSWTAANDASSYTFIAYDLSTNRQADIQSYIPQTFTTFIGTLGHSYSLSLTAYSATYIPSVTAGASVAIVIPNPPTGLSLCNAGALVTVSWTVDALAYSRYSYTVVNAASPGTTFYQSSPYVNSGDTFLATVGQTFRVNLFGTSLCNVTSVSSTSNSIFIYQPSIASVTATSVGADITLIFPPDSQKTCEYFVTNNLGYQTLLYSPSKSISDISALYNSITLSFAAYTQPRNGYISYTVLNNSYNLNGTQYLFTVTPYSSLVPGPSVSTPGVNPLTLYKPTTPGQFTVRNQGSDLLLNWQSSAIGTIPVPTLVPNYRVDVNQVTPSGTFTVTSPQYITGTSTTFTGYNSTAGQLSISVTAIIPGYDQNLSATYINGFTSNKNFTIPNQTSISIKQNDYANPQILSVTIPPMVAPYIWFFTTATGVTPILGPTPFQSKNYTVISNVNQSIFQTCNVTVSTGLYYTISAYGWSNGTDFPGPASAIAIANANPNPYPATTFNVSYGSIRTSHSGTIITVSWAPVTQASYYDIQEFNSENVQIGGGGLLLASPSWVSTVTHTAGSFYKFQITAFTVSQANFAGGIITPVVIDGLLVGANLPNSKNPYFPSPISSDETLYIPGPVVNLTAVQFLQTVSLTWLQPSSWTPQASITTTSADTTYFIQQLSGTTTTVVNSKTISGGGGGTLQTSFNISAGRTYTFTVSTTYYGIPTTTASTVSLATVNPQITALTLTDNGNKTLTLAGTANTAGDWYANISTGSTAVYPGTATSTNTTSFTLNQTVPAGSSWTGFAKFIATLGGLTVSSQTAQLTLPNPTITTCSITDNFTDGTLTLNLVASIGGSGSYTPKWTVPATVNGTGTGQPVLSLFTSPANSASTTAVYKKALVAQTYSFTGITVSADGFQSSASSASFTTPTFTVSQNPAQIIITNPRTLSATFFLPELTNTGPPRTLSTSLTLSSTISWNFPTSLTNGGTLASYAPLTGSGIVNVSYTAVPPGVMATFPANSVSVNYQGYTVSLGSAVSYDTPNPVVSVGTAATRFVDNHDGTLTLFLVATGCTQGSGNVTWSVPSPISGAPSGSISVVGSPGTGASTSVVYTGTTHGSTYTITQGGVSVLYSGYSNSNATSIGSPAVALPQITAISGVYFGCSEDKALTGPDSITVSVSSSFPATWTITACSALTLNLSSGQGTRAIQWAFSGGLKTKAYTFTVGLSSTTVTLTKPSANVTPSFSSFVGSPSITGVTTSIANRSGSTFVFFGATNATDMASTITLDTQSTLTTGIYTVSAAAVSNGILGTISSYQFAVCPQPTAIKWGSTTTTDDHALATSNTIIISFTPGGSGSQVCALVSGNAPPSSCSSAAPTGETSTQGTFTGGTEASFTVTLDTAGSKNFYVIGKSTTVAGAFYGVGSSVVSFTYNKNESVLSGTGAGSPGSFTYTGLSGKALLNAAVTSGTGGGYLSGRGRTFTVTGWRGLLSNDVIKLTPASDGTGETSPGSGFTNGGKGGAGIIIGDFAPARGLPGFAGGGAARFTISAAGVLRFDAKIPGGGGRGGDANGGDGSHNWKGGGGGGGGGTSSSGGRGFGGGFDSGDYLNAGAGGGTAAGLGGYLNGYGGDGGQGGYAPNSVGGFGGGEGSNAQLSVVTSFDTNTMDEAVATVGAGYSVKLYWLT